MIKGDILPQARFELDKYTTRVLDVVKGKYGLKNRQQALERFVQEHGPEYAEMELDETLGKKLDSLVARHKSSHGRKVMSDDELDELLGL